MVQKNERIKSVGKVKLITGRNLPKKEGRDKWGSLEASKKSGMLKKRRIWKNSLRRTENQEKEEEGSPEKVGNEEEGGGMARRIPKEAQGI